MDRATFSLPVHRILSLVAFGSLLACTTNRPPPPDGKSTMHSPTASPRIPFRCTSEWNALVERRLRITDSDGHGPDIGSQEWMMAVGRKSGVDDGSGHSPDPGSDEWCRAVDFKVFGRR